MNQNPNYRHSFSNPERTDRDKFNVNRFGHTILGGQMDDNVLPHEDMSVSLDPAGGILADRKATIFEHPAVILWAKSAGFDPSVFNDEEEIDTDVINEDIIEASIPKPLQSLFDHLPTSLDELNRESQLLHADSPMASFPLPHRLNRSSPQDVQIRIPANLGTTASLASTQASQAASQTKVIPAQRCLDCHGSHPENARFCPHCGIALTRFCIHCGYQFVGSEKFCPDCGERR